MWKVDKYHRMGKNLSFHVEKAAIIDEIANTKNFAWHDESFQIIGFPNGGKHANDYFLA